MRRMPILCLVGLIALVGCKKNMPSYEAGNVKSARKVLVAGEDTAFKRRVVAKVIEKLGTQDWYFRIIGLDQLSTQEAEQYGAILLLAGVQGGLLDERLTNYLKLDPTNEKLVLLYTRGVEGPLPESVKLDLQVDAVSSASRVDRMDMRAEQLAALLMRRF